MKKPLVYAHRGASGYRPENTMSSFREALTMLVDGIELDVHMDREGHLIVCHDEQVDRTTDGKGLIKDFTLKELKELDAGGWFHETYRGEQIPLLEEVLGLIASKGILLNIELKSGPILYPGIEAEVIRQVKHFGMEDRVVFSSFNHFSLVEVKRIDPRLKTAILYMEALVNPWNYAKSIGAEGLHPYFYSVIPEIVAGAVGHGMSINPFTVNEPEQIEALCKMGVSGLITNYPDRARSIIQSLGRHEA